jgi:hypothetical protein
MREGAHLWGLHQGDNTALERAQAYAAAVEKCRVSLCCTPPTAPLTHTSPTFHLPG